MQTLAPKISILRGKLLPAFREHWGIILITALAAAFRFYLLDLHQFLPLQASLTYQALKILEQGQLASTSLHVSPLHLPHPPLMIYIELIPLLLARSPLLVVGFITFLNLLAVPLTYFTALRLFEKKTALGASFLSAVSLGAVDFSRTANEMGLIIFFTALIAYLVLPALTENNRQDGRIFAGLVATALMAQTHLLGLLGFLQVGVLLFIFRRRINWRTVLWGLLTTTLISLPYIIGVLYPAEDFEMRKGFALSGPWVIDGQALGQAINLVSATWRAESTLSLVIPLPLALGLTQIVEKAVILFIALGIGEGALRLMRKNSADNHLMILVWFLVPIALMTIHSRPVATRYLLFTYPASFILAGLGARHFWRGYLQIVILIFAAGLVLVFASGLYVRYQSTEERAGLSGFTNLPLRYSVPLGQTIIEIPMDVYLKAPDAWLSGIAGTLIASYQEFEQDHFLVLRSNRPALYVLLDPRQLAPGFAFSRELTDKRIDLPNNRSIRFFLFSPRSIDELARLPSQSLDLATNIGWRLLGYDLPRSAAPGDTVEFTTYWLVQELPPDRLSLFYKPFVHLLNSQGILVTQSDGHGQAGSRWREDDFYIDTSQMPLPANLPQGEYWIYTGLYDPNTSIRAVFSEGQDHLLLGPVYIE